MGGRTLPFFNLSAESKLHYLSQNFNNLIMIKRSFLPLFSLLVLCSFWACTDVDLAPDTQTSDPVANLAGDFTRTLIVEDYLYGVSHTDVMTYDISNREKPALVDRTPVGRAVETIYHYDGNLFIGSRTGMYVYTISRSGVPVRQGDYQYSNVPGIDVEPCDPVVAEGSTAYASLYTGDNLEEPCGRTQDLQTIVVLDVSNLNSPTLIQTHDTPSPRGLAIDGNLLFVCNNQNGLTVLDVSDSRNFVELTHIDGVDAWDAIIDDGRLVVVAATEVVQYDYSDPSHLVELSRISYPRD